MWTQKIIASVRESHYTGGLFGACTLLTSKSYTEYSKTPEFTSIFIFANDLGIVEASVGFHASFLCIQCKSLAHIFLQNSSCPDTELCAALGLDPVTNRNNDVKIVELNLIDLSVCSSCCKFCNN